MGLREGLILVAVIVLAAAGCAPSGSDASRAQVAPEPIRVMPDIAGRRLDEAATLLTKGGLRVVVVVPSRTSSAAEASPTPSSSVTRAPITVPELRKVYAGAPMPQPIMSQLPSAGVPVASDTTVTLTGGRHPGGDVEYPWVWQHMYEVKRQGSAPCFECHQEVFCSGCHVEL